MKGAVMLGTLINEYGLPWVFNRALYSVKLKLMRVIPGTEIFFEREVNVSRLDLFDVDVYKLEKFLNDIPLDKRQEIISIANKASEGKVKAFSSKELDYGDPINWHCNPITGIKTSKDVKWYQIPDFDQERGDIKVVWEPSRFGHFFYFARAYLLTKDEKYHRIFSHHLAAWLKDNTYSYGVNYKCGQEAALRMISALITYSVFRACGFNEEIDYINMSCLVADSYKKILSNFFYAHRCIKNNHTISEITGMIVGAWCCRDHKMIEKGYRLLDEEINNQFLTDGGYVQYSFNYQRFALQLLLFVLKISKKTDLSISDKNKNLVGNSVMLMYNLQDKSGDLPNYGSNDGALIFPVTACGYRNFTPTINAVHASIAGERLYNCGMHDEELIWFVDKNTDELPVVKVERVSASYEQSGLYSFRHKRGFMMIILQKFSSRPDHMDQLHIDLWHRGKNVLCDGGTYSYAKESGLDLTAAHNTVQIDSKEQMKAYGPFLRYGWPKADKVECNSEYFSGAIISKNGYGHRRVVKQRANGYLVEDYVYGDGDVCRMYLHTPCQIIIRGDGFDLVDNNIILARATTKENIAITKAFRSLYYLEKEEISCICITKKKKSDCCIMKLEFKLF